MTKRENLKRIYKQIPHGKRLLFVQEVADHFKVSVHSVRVNWLSGLFCPPPNNVDEVIKMGQSFIRILNK